MTKRFPNLYPFTRRCICSPYLVLFLACLRAHRAVVYRIGVCIYQRHLHRGTIPYAWTYHHILLPIPCPSVVYTSWPYPSYRLTVPMYHTYVPNVPHPRTVPVPYPYRTPYRTRTVPMYRIHVPNLPYPCTQCTVPMYPMYRTHVPNVPYTCTQKP